MTKVSARANYPSSLLLILLSIGLIWAKSSWGKWSSGTFHEGLGPTLIKFASKNPYPWFKSFLETYAIPNVSVFGWLTLLGETFTAIGLIVSVLYFLFNKTTNQLLSWLLISSLATGCFLNIIFWLASGWTSPANDSLNLLMAVISGIAIYFVFTNKSK